MKYKEKEKLWLTTIKEKSKADAWKFKSHFIYKSFDNLFFSSTFYVSRIENAISGWLGYKTVNIDNVFWDIIDEQPNKKMPLSFRGEAAFCVRSINYFNYKVDIKDELNPDKELSELLRSINSKVSEKSKIVRTISEFQTDLLRGEKENSVGVITGYIEQGQIDNAVAKIKEYKSQRYNSGFRFEDNKDFYDLALDYCKKNYD